MGKEEITTIPYVRKCFYAAYANLPTSGIRIGDLGFATDRLVLYRWSGAAWEYLTFHFSSGLAANIPTAADLPNGSCYFEEDTTLLKQVQAGAWATIAQPPPSTRTIATGTYTGDGNDDRNIPTGFKCSAVLILGEGGIAYTGFILADKACTFNGNDDGSYLHATDGFNIYAAQFNLNLNPYTYWAISE